MEKFLYTDGINGVKEAQSQEELEDLLASAVQDDKIRVWLFNSNEWLSYAAYRKLFPAPKKKELAVKEATVIVATNNIKPVRAGAGKRWLKRFLFLLIGVAGAFLVLNFTGMSWKKTAPLVSVAARPDNTPIMDIDSLISDIEYDRGEFLDKNTKNNLRLRNTWPDRIELKLNAEKETRGSATRFSAINISIDNTTGLNLDKAVVKLFVWKDNKVNATDTIRFSNISYDKLTSRTLDAIYRGDSLSVSFESIRAKAFNFCYSAGVKNNSGNYNDRWFCRE